jgi:sialidase-1
MEPGVIELRDGRILQIIRTQMAQIWKSYSSDGGLTWTDAEPMGVVAPEAPATIARIPTTGDLVLFYNPEADINNPDHCGLRCPLSVAISRDEGMTWRRTVDLETDRTHQYAYVSCTFHKGRALLTYYVYPVAVGGQNGLSQKLISVPIEALYGAYQ